MKCPTRSIAAGISGRAGWNLAALPRSYRPTPRSIPGSSAHIPVGWCCSHPGFGIAPFRSGDSAESVWLSTSCNQQGSAHPARVGATQCWSLHLPTQRKIHTQAQNCFSLFEQIRYFGLGVRISVTQLCPERGSIAAEIPLRASGNGNATPEKVRVKVRDRDDGVATAAVPDSDNEAP